MFRAVFNSLTIVKDWMSVLAHRTSRRPGWSQRQSHPTRRSSFLTLEHLECRLTPTTDVVAASVFDSAIYEFDASTGALVKTLVAPNNPASLLSNPSGITVGPDQNLYISSQGNDSILEYNFSTNTLSTFIPASVLTPIASANGDTTFSPAGLRFGPDGDLYVSLNAGQAATMGGAVIRFGVTNNSGSLSYNNTNTAIATGLVQPTGLAFGTAVGDTTNLYVSNSGSPAITIAGTANIIKVTGATGASPSSAQFIAAGTGTMNYPTGLSWGPDGNFYVVDLGATGGFQGNVLQFSPNGTFIKVLTPTGQNPGSLLGSFPSDIAFDGNGHFLTANLGQSMTATLAGSINQYNTSGSFSKVLVASSAFPNTGTGKSGIAPSQLVIAPLTSTLSNQSVLEFRPNGTAVGTFSSSDFGSGQTFTYSLVSGTGATGNNSFTISGNQLLTNDAFDVAAQSSYSIRVRTSDGTTTTQQTFTITITADPKLIRTGTTLVVYGTSAADTYYFTAGSTQDSMNLNGTALAADTATVKTVSYVSNGGSDTVTLAGLGGDYASLTPTLVTLTGTGYVATASNATTVTVTSSGNATADFGLTASMADSFQGTQAFSRASLSGVYSNTAVGFAHTHGFAEGNTHATAILATTSGSADIFGSIDNDYSFVQGPSDNYDSYVVGFAHVTAYANSASAIAYIQTSTASSDLYNGTSTSSEIKGAGYDNFALNFQRVQAYAGGSGQTAKLQQFNSTDPYILWPGSVESKGSNYDNFAIGFASVTKSSLH